MTLTIEATRKHTAILEQEAQRRGQSVEFIANELFLEIVEDLEDAADANRILRETDPSTWHSLDELRKVVRG